MSKGDFATYRRLLRYLSGNGHLVVAAFLFMFVEAFFTVGSIAMLKPVLDLLQQRPLTDMVSEGKRPFVASPVMFDVRGTAAVVAAGRYSSRDLDLIRTRTSQLSAQTTATLLNLDLGSVSGMDSSATSVLAFWLDQIEASGRPVALVLPADMQDFPRPASDFDRAVPPDVLVLKADSPFLAAFRRAHSSHITMDPPARSGPLDSAKRTLADILRPALQQLQAYSDAKPENRFIVICGFVAAMIVLAALGVMAKMATGYLSNMLAARAVQRLRDDLFRHMMGLDLAYFHQHSAGTLMSTVIQDAQAVDAALEILFSSVMKTPITVGALLFAMFVVSPQLTIATLTAAPVIAIIIYLLGRRVRKVSGRIQLVKSTLSGILEECFNGMRIVKGYCTEEREAARFAEANHRIFRLGLKTIAAEEIGGGLSHLVGMATVGLMVLAGGWFVVVQGSLSPGDFVVFVGFLSQVFRPMRDVSKVNSKLQRGLAGCDRVFGTLDTPPHIVSPPPGVAIPAAAPQRGIEFVDVGFTYGPDRPPALRGISMTLRAGRSLAIVGETGSGKSTLANLLPRFHDPTSGRILWDGTDLRQFDLRSLRSQIALITQDVVLFDDTVAGNIAYGCEPAPDMDRIVAAATAARAHSFIDGRMPLGYNTRIGARGVRLSGGERQRLAIARAILRNAPVLVLDEATSALDSETEALVQQALQELFPGRTVLVIAHRLSTIQACDSIAVMSQGRIVEQGSHAELMAADGYYARFQRLQSGSAESGTPALSNSLEVLPGPLST